MAIVSRRHHKANHFLCQLTCSVTLCFVRSIKQLKNPRPVFDAIAKHADVNWKVIRVRVKLMHLFVVHYVRELSESSVAETDADIIKRMALEPCRR
jgi:hypothetical protein